MPEQKQSHRSENRKESQKKSFCLFFFHLLILWLKKKFFILFYLWAPFHKRNYVCVKEFFFPFWVKTVGQWMYIGIYYFKITFLQTTVSGGDVITVQVIFGVDIFVGLIIWSCFHQQRFFLTSIQLFFYSSDSWINEYFTFSLNVSSLFFIFLLIYSTKIWSHMLF